jgi:N-acetylglucosaminyl-diphospho-decaprenol L-rhamnosyltransferase
MRERWGRPLTESATAPPLDVVVAVVTYNSEHVVTELLRSLPAGLQGCTWSLIVADNASQDATVELVRTSVPSAHIVSLERNLGYAAGINAALANAPPAGAALVLNADTRLIDGSVATMLATLDEVGVGIVVPRLVHEDGRLGPSLRREPTIGRSLADAVLSHRVLGRFDGWSEAITDPRAYATRTKSDWAAGPAMLISAECMSACGPWDESFFLYSEETEYCLRARERGFALVLEPRADLVHLGGGSNMSPNLWSLVVVNRIRLYSRTHSRLATIAFWLVAVFREGTRAILGRATSRLAFSTLISPRRMREAADRARGGQH